MQFLGKKQLLKHAVAGEQQKKYQLWLRIK
jgi:hypothetical protein